jgi:hypothetical protein
VTPALQKATAAADRASQEAARLREQLAELQRAVDANNPTAATTAAAQVWRTGQGLCLPDCSQTSTGCVQGFGGP